MAALAYTDNCVPNGTVIGTDSAPVGTCPTIITRTWTFTDSCGNSSLVTQLITVTDTVAPVFAAPPAPISVQCISDVPPIVSLAYTDNCNAPGSVMGTDSAPVGNCPAVITRTWTFTDSCGNVSTATQLITIS